MLKLIETTKVDEASARSQTSLVYTQLRREILSGARQPGEKLKIADISDELKVSPGAVREALSRLIPEQLAVSQDQKGFTVAPLSTEDLSDITDFRCEIESIALRRSVERGGLEWEAAIIAAAHQLRGTQITGNLGNSLSSNWVDRHAAFHGALVGACGSKRLLAMHAQLYEQSERYRQLSVHIDSKRDIVDEHDEILKAALARDAGRLVKLMAQHIRHTTALIIGIAQGPTKKKQRRPQGKKKAPKGASYRAG